MRYLLGFILSLLACGAWGEAEMPLNKVKVTTDPSALERGAETAMTVCAGCHSLKYIHFRELEKLGIAKSKVDEWRGSNPMGATIASQMAPDMAESSFGKVPPDLSLMVKAREGGADYIYSYLLGYYTLPDGSTGNHYFPPTKMPDVLQVAGVTDPAERAKLEQTARDVTSFLAWAADPHEQERKSLGYFVLAYLVVFTIMLFFLKQRIWSRLDRLPPDAAPARETTH